MTTNLQTLKTKIQATLKEDLPQTDITSETLLLENTPHTASLITKEPCLFSGTQILKTMEELTDITITPKPKEGTPFKKNEILFTINGPIKSILKIERTLLNLLQRTCAIATQTNTYIQTLNDPTITITDTRKTTPLWRDIEKQAVLAGGGTNHRHNLSDMILIKENHLKPFQTPEQIKTLAPRLETIKKQKPTLPITCEIETLSQLETLPIHLMNILLLDNFTLETLKKAIQICQNKQIYAKIEVSGGITLKTIQRYQGLAIDRISIGSLTHSVKSIDLSLLIKGPQT
jgi:nicotinate-nucleotide pyrophosphorylase (carboxylating)